MQRKKVIRVTTTDFELEDGTIFPHPVEMERVPTVEEFQEFYDYWFSIFEELKDGDRETLDNWTSLCAT